MNKKLEKLLTEMENIEPRSWSYHHDTSGFEEYPNDHYTASLRDMTLVMMCLSHGIDVYVRDTSHSHWNREGFMSGYKRILTIDREGNDRVLNIYRKVGAHRIEQERKRNEEYDKKEKTEKEARKSRGYDGNIDDVLNKLK